MAQGDGAEINVEGGPVKKSGFSPSASQEHWRCRH